LAPVTPSRSLQQLRDAGEFANATIDHGYAARAAIELRSGGQNLR